LKKLTVLVAAAYIFVSMSLADKPQITQAVTALLAIVFILSRLGSTSVRLPSGAVAALITYAAWTWLTLLWTPDLETGFSYCWRLLVAVLFALIVLNAVDDDDDVAILCQAIVLAGYVVFYQLYQNVRIGKGFWGAGGTGQFRYATDALQPNAVAWILAFSAAFGWMLITWNRKSTRPFILLNYGMLLVALIGIIYTGSRGGFIALTVAYLPVLVGLWKRPAGAVIIGTAVATILPATLVSPQLQGSITRIMNSASSADTDKLSGRLDLWEAATTIAIRKPFLGSGIGGFRDNSMELGLNTSGGVTGAHQAFLDVLSQTGAVGLFFFCFLCFQVGKSVANFPREIKLVGWCVLFTILSVLLGTHEQNSNFVLIPTTVLIAISVVTVGNAQKKMTVKPRAASAHPHALSSSRGK